MIERFQYLAVVIALACCLWSLYIGVRCRPDEIVFGRFGKALLIINSFVMSVVCCVTLIWHVFEILQGKS